MDELLRDFLTETGEHVEAAGAQLVQLERDPTDMAMIAAIFRLLHTIKGTCGFLGLGRLGRLAHAAEALLQKLREGVRATPEAVALILAAVDRIRFILAEIETREAEPEGADDELVAALAHEAGGANTAPSTDPVPSQAPLSRSSDRSPQEDRRVGTVRVTVESLEQIMTLVSELVLARNQLAVIARRIGDIEIESTLQRLSAIVTDLQESVMRARMQPLERLFASLPRLVRDLAHELGKQIDVTFEGGDTELDRQLVELVRDPLTHLLRNCADHGIETPAQRIAVGKQPTGHIRVVASHVAGQILIEVSDDGRGLDHARIAAKALALGLVTEGELAALDRDEISRFIFAPGFSTAATITSVSGRGVGLDVVRDNIESIGGVVTVESGPQSGAVFLIRIPLTLAIAPALIVAAGGERFALPQVDVLEIVSIASGSPHRIETVQGCDVLHLRGEIVPLASLETLLQLPATASNGEEPVVAILRAGGVTLGIVVHAVEDVQEIVVKPVGAALANLRLYSGHTILGDGTVVLILDATRIASSLGIRGAPARRGSAAMERSTAGTSPILLFRAGTAAVRALPLSLVTRIETVRTADMEHVAGRLVATRNGRLVPFIPFFETIPQDVAERPALMIEADGQTFGLLVDEIIDVVNSPLDVEIATDKSGLLGAAPVGGHIAEIIDLAHFAAKVRPPSPAPRGCKVLLVDRRPFFRDLLAPVLSAAGCRVVAFESSVAACPLVAAGEHFDIAIVEAQECEVSALEEHLSKRVPATPVIALVAHPDELGPREAARFAAVCGAFDRRGLLTALEHALRHRAAPGKAIVE